MCGHLYIKANTEGNSKGVGGKRGKVLCSLSMTVKGSKKGLELRPRAHK